MLSPSPIQLIAKNGVVNQSNSEMVLVHGEYVFCVTPKNQSDERWKPNNEGRVHPAYRFPPNLNTLRTQIRQATAG